MNRKVLIALMHPDEWNQYIPFNGYIASIKKDYDHVVAVVERNPMALLSEADEYYTVKNTLYPGILDSSSRVNNSFINKCVEKVKEDFKDDELTFVSWQKTNYHGGIVNILGPAIHVYTTSFKYAQDWYKSGGLIYPTADAYNRMKDKYSGIFNENTFVVLTRNFKNKAVGGNTKRIIPGFEELINHLTTNGIKIVNVGFPPCNCNIDNENYVELNDPFSQDELLGLFYLSQGVLLQANAGGFVGHLASNADMFPLTHEWFSIDDTESFELIKYKTKKVKTMQMKNFLRLQHLPDSKDNFGAILSELKNHKSTVDKIFQEPKKITYVE
jgi:hypothetical protein